LGQIRVEYTPGTISPAANSLEGSMTDKEKPGDELKQEFEKLGRNLRMLIQGAWESEKRKQASQEVQRGLNEVGNALSNAATQLTQEPAARKLQEEVDQLAERVRSGELAEKARSELIEALQGVNERLNDLVDQLEQDTERDQQDGVERP
jgi:gas vesicle protein